LPGVPNEVTQEADFIRFLDNEGSASMSIIYDAYSDKFHFNSAKEEGRIVILSKGPGRLTMENLLDNFDLLVSNSQIEAESVLCDTLRSCRNVSNVVEEQDCIFDLIEMLRQDINTQVDFFKDFDEEDCSDIKTVDEELNLW